MAIVQSCCCWQSVRTGTYASASYSLIYFIIAASFSGVTIQQDVEYLKGNLNKSQTHSFLEPTEVTYPTMVYYVIIFISSLLGVIASIFIFVGLALECRYMLLPWIVIVSSASFVDLSHSVYWIAFSNQPSFNPTTGMVYTMELFIFFVNGYALICVISQYQEYKAGRGTAEYHRYLTEPATMRYSKCDSGQQPAITMSTCISNVKKGNSARERATSDAGRRVQFPDEIEMEERSIAQLCPTAFENGERKESVMIIEDDDTDDAEDVSPITSSASTSQHAKSASRLPSKTYKLFITDL